MRGPEIYWICSIAVVVGAAAGPFVCAKVAPRPPLPVTQDIARESPPGLRTVSSPRTAERGVALSYAAGLTSGVAEPNPPLQRLKLARGEIEELAERCAPEHPSGLLASIVQVESGGHPLRIGVNGARSRFLNPKTAAEASAWAAQLIAEGENIDLGLAQINGRNLANLGLSVKDAFDPCRNLAAAGVVIDRGYRAALKINRPHQSVLQTAFSLYNTGNPDRGLVNGYVAKFEASGAPER